MSLRENVGGFLSLPASADLSTKQYYCVKIDTNGQIAVAGLGDFAVGVLMDKPSAQGVIGAVAPFNGRKLKGIAGVTIAKGDLLKADAAGKLAVAVKANGAGITGSNVLGVAIESAVANDVFQFVALAAGAVPTTLA